MARETKIRIRTQEGAIEVLVLVTHPMETGMRKDKATDKLIPAHFITQLKFEHDGKTVFAADWGGGVSKDPYVKFSFKGAKKGDELKISWIDNKGATDTTAAKIQ